MHKDMHYLTAFFRGKFQNLGHSLIGHSFEMVVALVAF